MYDPYYYSYCTYLHLVGDAIFRLQCRCTAPFGNHIEAKVQRWEAIPDSSLLLARGGRRKNLAKEDNTCLFSIKSKLALKHSFDFTRQHLFLNSTNISSPCATKPWLLHPHQATTTVGMPPPPSPRKWDHRPAAATMTTAAAKSPPEYQDNAWEEIPKTLPEKLHRELPVKACDAILISAEKWGTSTSPYRPCRPLSMKWNNDRVPKRNCKHICVAVFHQRFLEGKPVLLA